METYKITTNNENLSSKISLVKVNSSFDEKSKKPVDSIDSLINRYNSCGLFGGPVQIYSLLL